ncbi:MAG: SRPBCC family protein [Actinomycetota bacterium]
MSAEPINLTVSRVIDATPERLYELISDVTRMGEWSPETTAAEWIGDAAGPAVGARFKGTNRTGPNTWSTKPTVTIADPGRAFAFKVPGGAGPVWTYRFDSVVGGTEVAETVAQTKRSPWFIRLLQKRAGITDRSADLREKMTVTLANLAEVAESSAAAV